MIEIGQNEYINPVYVVSTSIGEYDGEWVRYYVRIELTTRSITRFFDGEDAASRFVGYIIKAVQEVNHAHT